jgi:hypothetical protein
MEIILEHFCLSFGLNVNISLDYNLDLDIKEIYDSEFNHIDGEESDNGIIRYYLDNNLICERFIFGGDNSEWKYTEYGFNILKLEIMKYFDWLIIYIKKDLMFC